MTPSRGTPEQHASPATGRHAAVAALIDDARRFPQLRPASAPEVGNLSHAEAALAVAIHRTVLQRWLTLEYLLSPMVRQPWRRLEPAMRAVLLAGAAQLLFMQRLPDYAIVDEMVSLARRVVRPKAGPMVNAVLRRVAALVQGVSDEPRWRPAADVLPLDAGAVHLAEATLPDPRELDEHLAVATSHPRWLVRRWLEAFEPGAVVALCHHGVRTPVTIVAVEPAFAAETPETPEALEAAADWQPHATPGFVVWHGSHEAMRAFLQGHPHRRVQDPAASLAVAATRDLEPATILDYCAGRGTKTCQLAATHPQARIVATDPDPQRHRSLRELGERFEQVSVVSPGDALAVRADLILLDVPCSNTGVLARRPGARYRLDADQLDQLARLQQQIRDQALQALAPGGAVLYTTCSLEPEENDQQARWLEEQAGCELERESLTLPAGHGPTHHDGSYHALVG